MIYLLLLLVGVCSSFPQDVQDNLPPPVKPEPRSGNFSVIPQPRQSNCNYFYAFTTIGEQVLLQSPNWPGNYGANSNCRYTFNSPQNSVISLSCTEFNVESSSGCNYDAFFFSLTGDSQFRDPLRTCGRGTFARTSTTNALTVGFTNDAGNPYSQYLYRFQCTLQTVSNGAAPPPPPPTAAPTAAPTVAPVQSNCSCGLRNEAPRIVGGSEALVNEFPWRCNLYSPRMGVFCGATVIASRCVLTAAHCTAAIPAGEAVYVDCADHDISSATETTNVVIKVISWVPHPQYNKETQDNDLSVLKLETALTFSRTIQPICLPFKMVGKPVDGLTVTASGWGTVSSGGSQSVVLKKVDLPVLGTQQCQRYYGTSVTNNMICTYSPGSDTCQGDSGGSIDYKDPDTGRYMDLGVVSWGVGCAGTNQPGVYAKVTNYLDWILQQCGENVCRVP